MLASQSVKEKKNPILVQFQLAVDEVSTVTR
jgi:hypothetical protein